MRRKLTSVAVAGALGVAGLTGVGAAAASTEDGSTAVERLTEALRSLVDDGTIDQEQADAVAEALAARPELRPDRALRGGPGGLSLDVAGGVLDMSRDDLRVALRSGATLAELAEDRGVAVDTLVDALVQAARHRLDDAVSQGRMSPERAESMVEGLEEHVRRHVDGSLARGGHRTGAGHERGDGRAGHQWRDGHGVRPGFAGPRHTTVGADPSR